MELPRKWVVVSDGSTDRTDEIVREYARGHSFMEFVRRDTAGEPAGFASKVRALLAGWERLREVDCEFVGNLDADISLGEEYYGEMIRRFRSAPKLGIAGGCIHEFDGERFRERFLFNPRSVPGAIQLFRRECLEQIGGWVPVDCGGEDWIAETWARIRGWEVKAFPDVVARNHKGGASSRGVWRERWRQGKMEHAVGSHPLFVAVKCMSRVREKPYIAGALVRAAGYAACCWHGEKRPVSAEFVEFLRKEQLRRLRFVRRWPPIERSGE
jgi:cellulose synthase/poly-beta-1,6-N-acetylglucosamine synthase-like glycosyltransferase